METVYQRFMCATTKAEINQLFADGYDLTKRFNTAIGRNYPIHFACETGQLEVVQALVERGADLRIGNWLNSPIKTAAHSGNIKIVEYLVSVGCDIGAAIYQAVDKDHIDVLEYLLSLDRDINDTFGIPIDHPRSLECACVKGNRNALDLLLKAGASINSKNIYHPLIIVADGLEDRFATQFAEQLVIYGANYNCRSNFTDRTPLYVACQCNKIELVNFLISLRCEVNTVHDEQPSETPLIMACSRNNTEIVKLLIAVGADTKYVDRFGKQAIEYTASGEIRNLLSL
jgi:ankyrin repeat protein